MVQGYNESRLKSSFRKFYGRYNDLVCDYKLSLTHMQDDLFHTICSTVILILALTTGNPVKLISTKGAQRVWPVSRGCLLLLGTWSYLRISRRFVLPYTRFCNCLFDYDYVLHIVSFAIMYITIWKFRKLDFSYFYQGQITLHKSVRLKKVSFFSYAIPANLVYLTFIVTEQWSFISVQIIKNWLFFIRYTLP
jgi:hypothetical protein